MAVILLDHSQGHVDSGGYAGRSPEGAVLNVNRIRPHIDVGEGLLKVGAILPMRRRAMAAQETGAGEDEGAAANGSYTRDF